MSLYKCFNLNKIINIKTKKLKKYFEGINALRFIGAFSVILGHIELIKSFYGLPNLMCFSFYKNTNGHVGVILFFVISGFLITYFLLEEIKNNNSINYKKFYLKRLLRIWPIYYIMIVFSIFLMPKILFFLNNEIIKYTPKEYYLYLSFLPNIAKANQNFIPGATHLWSIGVEEQFYLFWPLVIIFFRKNILMIFIIIFLIISLTPSFIDFSYTHFNYLKNFTNLKNFISKFFLGFKINAMALGGIIAYIAQRKKITLNLILLSVIEISLSLFILISWLLGLHFGVFSDEVYALIFSLLLLSITNNKNSKIIFKNCIIDYLGKISYGLYVYHWVVIVLVIEILKKININFNEQILSSNFLIYIFSIGLTIVLSHFSYKHIELYFIKKIK